MVLQGLRNPCPLLRLIFITKVAHQVWFTIKKKSEWEGIKNELGVETITTERSTEFHVHDLHPRASWYIYFFAFIIDILNGHLIEGKYVDLWTAAGDRQLFGAHSGQHRTGKSLPWRGTKFLFEQYSQKKWWPSHIYPIANSDLLRKTALWKNLLKTLVPISMWFACDFIPR